MASLMRGGVGIFTVLFTRWATTTMASLMRGGVGIFTVLFTREEASSILAATTRPRRSFYSARRGHEDDGGEGFESPRRGSIFSLRRSSHVSFCPKFHFYFCEWQWNLVLHHFVLISMQQHVNRARAPKHVMRVEIYWEKKYRKGLLSITRSGRKIKNIMSFWMFPVRKNGW